MHVLVYFAECKNALIKIPEGNIPIHDPKFNQSNEYGTLRPIRTVCKAFAFGGMRKLDVTLDSPFGLRTGRRQVRAISLTRFSHNTFNIPHYNNA